MAKRNKGRIKKWMQFNKPAVTWMAVILVYTIIMLAVIFGLGRNLSSCSSGTLSKNNNGDVNVETSMKPAS